MTKTPEESTRAFWERIHPIPNRRVSVLRDSQGVVIILALLILLVATLIGISAVSTTTTETKIAGNERLYNNAFYVADAGIDYFYATIDSYVTLAATSGGIDSAAKGLNLGGGRFNVTWKKVRDEVGPPPKVEFLVVSEGISPNFPTAARVVIEALIESTSLEGGVNRGGDT
jgi:hypothetical protein